MAMKNNSYEQLTESQKQAVFHVDGPVLVLAGPGSGKTRVITYRIAALIEAGVNPANICAITFTNKAAEEMRQRAFALCGHSGVHISTFHSLCVRILRRYAAAAGVKANFSIYDARQQLSCMKRAVKDCGLSSTNFSPARMLSAVSTLKNNLESVDDLKAVADDFFSKTLVGIYRKYEDILEENNALDFDDLLVKTAELLKNNPNICRQLGQRFRYLLVDEYQDTNHAQYVIAKALVSLHNNICVTGDPDQSIYRWRGADIGNILAFESDWPDAVVVKLEENFRSTPNILRVADSLIAFNKNRKQKTLIPTRPAGEDIAIDVFEDEAAEAEALAEKVKQLAAGGKSMREIAVFYRVNAMSRVIEEAFIKNKIPYQILRGVEFYGRKEIRDILAYLKVLVNPDDTVALLRIINEPARGIGKTTIGRVADYANSKNIGFYDALKQAGHIDSVSAKAQGRLAGFVNMIEGFKKDLTGEVAPLAERVFAESGLEASLEPAKGQESSSLENVNELLNSVAQYDRQAEEPSLVDYLQQIALFSDVDSYDTAAERVALMTLHAAKGLEFENVFIVGVEEGLLPHERSTDNTDEIEEERRLFFVGITRAKSGLDISYAQYRTVRGQMLRTIPSQFLYELGVDFNEAAEEIEYDYEDNQDNDTESAGYDGGGEFMPGQRVRSKKFGIGRVKEFIDMGEKSVVVVVFNTGQTKTLMVKYADLEKI